MDNFDISRLVNRKVYILRSDGTKVHAIVRSITCDEPVTTATMVAPNLITPSAVSDRLIENNATNVETTSCDAEQNQPTSSTTTTTLVASAEEPPDGANVHRCMQPVNPMPPPTMLSGIRPAKFGKSLPALNQLALNLAAAAAYRHPATSVDASSALLSNNNPYADLSKRDSTLQNCCAGLSATVEWIENVEGQKKKGKRIPLDQLILWNPELRLLGAQNVFVKRQDDSSSNNTAACTRGTIYDINVMNESVTLSWTEEATGKKKGKTMVFNDFKQLNPELGVWLTPIKQQQQQQQEDDAAS